MRLAHFVVKVNVKIIQKYIVINIIIWLIWQL